MSSVREVTDETFEQEVLRNNKLVLVDFWATWCGPCKQVGPIVEQVANEYAGIDVVKVDVDVAPRTAQRYKIMSVPTLMLFKAGEPVKSVLGAKPKAALVNALGIK